MRIRICVTLLFGLVVLTAARAQPTSDNLLTRASGNVASLLANKAVQEELKMSNDEVDKVRAWTKAFRTKAEEIRKDKGVDRIRDTKKSEPLPSEDMQKIDAANSVIRKESYKELGGILSKAQVERLKQIDLQNMGIDSFLDDEVGSELKLTETQKTAFQKLRIDVTKAAFDLIEEAIQGVTRVEIAQEKIQKSLKECCDKAVAMLSPEQMKKWQEMTGKPFNLPRK
jgi:hypothetical protein